MHHAQVFSLLRRELSTITQVVTCVSLSVQAPAEQQRQGEQWPGESTPNISAGMSQIMLVCCLWLAFCCSFSSQPSSARCVPWRRRGAHPATAGSRTRAFPWAGKGQAQGYPGEQRADSYTCIPNPSGGGFFKACPVPFEQIEG